MQALEDHQTFSSVSSSHLSVPNGMDPPDHTHYRQVIEPYFSQQAHRSTVNIQSPDNNTGSKDGYQKDSCWRESPCSVGIRQS
jgi:hypothetical protein